MTQTDKATLRAILLSLKEDIDDTSNWHALVDYGPDNGEVDWSDTADTVLGKAYLVVSGCAAMAPTTEGRQRCEEVQLHYNGYAESGYTDDVGCIAVGNYNSCDRYDQDTQTRVKTDGTPELLSDLLERLGVNCEWSDEWITCDECHKLMRVEADGFSWTSSYYPINTGEILCSTCWNKEQEGKCQQCGEELDTDCQGNPRCPDCDGPCPGCSDGPGPMVEDDTDDTEDTDIPY